MKWGELDRVTVKVPGHCTKKPLAILQPEVLQTHSNSSQHYFKPLLVILK
jgi:hypothetical protein